MLTVKHPLFWATRVTEEGRTGDSERKRERGFYFFPPSHWNNGNETSGPISKQSAPKIQCSSPKNKQSATQFLTIELRRLVLHHDSALYLQIHPALRQAPCPSCLSAQSLGWQKPLSDWVTGVQTCLLPGPEKSPFSFNWFFHLPKNFLFYNYDLFNALLSLFLYLGKVNDTCKTQPVQATMPEL